MKPNLERLQKLVIFLKSLDRHQFNYAQYVTKTNATVDCGTVCCAAGWMPEVFKEDSPFTWEDMIEGNYLVRVCSLDDESIKELFSEKEQAIAKRDITLHAQDVKIMAFFDLSLEQVNALFQGSGFDQFMLKLPITDFASSLPEVIHLFETYVEKHVQASPNE